MPGQGHTRKDLTTRPVLFFPLYSYLVVYQPDVRPIRIMAVLRGKRQGRHENVWGPGPRHRHARLPVFHRHQNHL